MHQPIPQGWIWEQSNSIYDGSGMAIFLPRLKLWLLVNLIMHVTSFGLSGTWESWAKQKTRSNIRKISKLLQENKKRKCSADLGLGCIAISKITDVWWSFVAIFFGPIGWSVTHVDWVYTGLPLADFFFFKIFCSTEVRVQALLFQVHKKTQAASEGLLINQEGIVWLTSDGRSWLCGIPFCWSSAGSLEVDVKLSWVSSKMVNAAVPYPMCPPKFQLTMTSSVHLSFTWLEKLSSGQDF